MTPTTPDSQNMGKESTKMERALDQLGNIATDLESHAGRLIAIEERLEGPLPPSPTTEQADRQSGMIGKVENIITRQSSALDSILNSIAKLEKVL